MPNPAKRGDKPQEKVQWFQSKSLPHIFHANVWMCNDEVELYVIRKFERWGWKICKDNERIAGSFTVRWSSEFAAMFEAEEHLAKEREGYIYTG